MQRRMEEVGHYYLVRFGEEKILCLFLEPNHGTSLFQPKVHLCMCVCVCVCMYANMQVHLCVLLCINIHVLLRAVYKVVQI